VALSFSVERISVISRNGGELHARVIYNFLNKIFKKTRTQKGFKIIITIRPESWTRKMHLRLQGSGEAPQDRLKAIFSNTCPSLGRSQELKLPDLGMACIFVQLREALQHLPLPSSLQLLFLCLPLVVCVNKKGTKF
jgi:hypothetical protein